MSKEQKKREDGFEHLEEALTSGEQFIEKNQKMIVNVVLVLVVIIAGYFGYNRFIAEPHAQEAANQIFGAQNYFEKDSFNLALNGDGNVLGFIEIADKYARLPAVIWQNIMPDCLIYIWANIRMPSNIWKNSLRTICYCPT